MFEKSLQTNEEIEVQEACNYCGDGAMAIINQGYAVLTNQRFMIFKKPMFSPTEILRWIIGFGLFAFLAVGNVLSGRGVPGMLDGLIMAAVSFITAALICKALPKGKPKDLKIEYDFKREDIESAEDGKRGVANMLVVKTKDGNICKISPKDKEKWKSILLKK
ncbi:MAG: hypothetical protein LBU66_01995 [Treponema sp.]|jgi:hypothetical protein|nr:hypothetical protein [Treponema sp.]